MPEPKLQLAFKYLTATQARKRLGLSRYQFDHRIELGILPKPTYVDTVKRGKITLQVRYFDETWIRTAQAILDNSMQAVQEGAKLR